MEIVYFTCVLIDLAMVKDIRAWALLSDHLSLDPGFVTYLLSDTGQANFFCFLVWKVWLIITPALEGHCQAHGEISYTVAILKL